MTSTAAPAPAPDPNRHEALIERNLRAPIPPRPPVSLNELEIERHLATDDTGNVKTDPAVGDLATAVRSGRLQAEKLADLVKALEADITKTPGGRALAMAKAAVRAGEIAAPGLDAAIERAKATVASLELNTAPPKPKDAMAVALHSEARTMLRTMSAGDRAKTLSAAVASGDDTVVAAACHGPAVMSGLTDEQQADLVTRYRHARHRDAADRLERLGRAIEASERAGRLLLSYVEAFASHPEAKRAAAGADRVDNLLKD